MGRPFLGPAAPFIFSALGVARWWQWSALSSSGKEPAMSVFPQSTTVTEKKALNVLFTLDFAPLICARWPPLPAAARSGGAKHTVFDCLKHGIQRKNTKK